MATQLKVTYRDIAKMMAKALPIEGDAFGAQVEENIQAIKAMPEGQRVALRVAYVFSCKVPREDRDDFFQDLTMTLLEAKTADERIAYTIARGDWKNFWEKLKTREHFVNGSLNRTVLDAEGHSVEWGDLLIGEVEYERLDAEIDGKALFHTLPEWIQRLISDKLDRGRPIKGGDRMMLDKWVLAHPSILTGGTA